MNLSASAQLSTRPPLEIFYILALPDWQPNEVTPFQGFARGLIDFIPMMELLPGLPPDLLDPVMEPNERLIRRRCGGGSWIWSPVNLSTLIAKRKPTIEHPFMVILTAHEPAAKAVAKWCANLRLKPIHISWFRVKGAVHPVSFDQAQLRHRLKAIVRHAASAKGTFNRVGYLQLLNAWKTEERRPSSLELHSHNVTKANEMTLFAIGENYADDQSGHLNVAPHEDYVRGITASAARVIEVCASLADEPKLPMTPPYPDIFLVGPAMYRGIVKRMEREIDKPEIKSIFRSLDRQRGYTMELKLDGDGEGSNEKHIDLVGPVLSLRGAEMKLLTTAVGLRTASTVAATIRLPPAVDRTGGVVAQLSHFLRMHDDPPPTKTSRVFNAVQDALLKAIPDEHIDLIRQNKSGIKIIADAPLEWLPIDGLPLGIRYDVSRINATPGNLFMEQIRPSLPMLIAPKDFRNYLVLSMFDEGDQIAPFLRQGALGTRDDEGKPIIGKFQSPKSPEEFAAAIDAFDGPLLIIDSHGHHSDGDAAGGLIIGGKAFDVWSLNGKVRMPPIVIISACDTHAFDRSHATVANGFLACGAAAVVATALPIRAKQAARFIMRIINRAVHYADIVNEAGRGVPWTNIVSGVLRMEIATDIIRTFEVAGHYDAATGSEMLLQTNMNLNPLRPDWYERLMERVSARCAIPKQQWDAQLSDIIAGSDAIRYLHLGNPEAITVGDFEIMQKRYTKVTN